jgi:hypothetical protein
MIQTGGTIFLREALRPIPYAEPALTGVIAPSSTTTFRYEVNESWKGIYPYIGLIILSGLVIFTLWAVSAFWFPQLLGFERYVIQTLTGISLTVDLISKINTVFTGVVLLLLFGTGLAIFNFWRYEILGEWRFTQKGLEITGHYTTLGSELIEYEYLKTIVTFRRQPYRFPVPGLGELASLYMYWKYGLSIIEIRTELSYLNRSGEHMPVLTIDYVENGREVASRIRDILKASTDKDSNWRGLPPGIFRRR